MRYHIVGIAGAGMSALAHVLLDQGHTVSGSDLAANQQTAALVQRGAHIAQGHDPAYIAGAEAVLATAAVKPEHPELAAARAAGLPVLTRADLWAQWSRLRTTVAIAGSHGKTTTTAMTALVLAQAGCEPGFLIGSDAPDLGCNARWGAPHAPLVVEADEYGYAFHALLSSVAVVTNVEWDHPDLFPTAAVYEETFAQFARNGEGPILTCGDGGVGQWAEPARANGLPIITYGLEPTNDYQAVLDGNETDFWVRRTKGLPGFVYASTATEAVLAPLPLRCRLAVPGQHNIRNALAALLVAELFGLDTAQAAATLGTFRGTARRFELLGEAEAITVIDDYAHHPTEVRATLAAARAVYPQRRIVAYVQPHTYSRTRALLADWGGAFAAADLVLVGAVYPAREQATLAEQAALRARLLETIGAQHPAVIYVGTVAEATSAVQALTHAGDVLLTMGAGDGHLVGRGLLETLHA